MLCLARAMIRFLEEYFGTMIATHPTERIQPILVGPPAAVLQDLFKQMTIDHSQEWEEPRSGRRIPILLVHGRPKYQEEGLISQVCTWDYAVTIRNSVSTSLILVTLNEWDRCPESIANATETLGRVRSTNDDEFFRSEPWPFLIGEMVRKFDVRDKVFGRILKEVYEDASYLEASLRSELPWHVAGQILEAKTFPEALCLAGLPSIETMGEPTEGAIETAGKTLRKLASYCLREGLVGSRQTLLEANAALLAEGGWHDVAVHVGALFDHLQATASSGLTFHQCPTKWYAPPCVTEWWSVLTSEVITKLLEEVGEITSGGKINLQCLDPLFPEGVSGEPVVVSDSVRLRLTSKEGTVVDQARVVRHVGRQAGVPILVTDGGAADTAPPGHDRPMRYRATAAGWKASDIKVLSLSRFECYGYARILGALRNPPPGRRRDNGSFEQEIRIARSGLSDLEVFRSAAASLVRINMRDGEGLDSAANPARFLVSLEDGDELGVVILDPNGAELGSWTVSVQIEDANLHEPSTRFEGLIQAHQKNKFLGSVRVRDSFVRRLESQYLEQEGSWRGLVACWGEDGKQVWAPDWSLDKWGDIPISENADARQKLEDVEPPVPYLETRSKLRNAILRTKHSIGEVDLSGSEFAQLVHDYLSHYMVWMETKPEAAVWTDCIALHAPQRNTQAGVPTPSGEPVALLLSPLHPLRLAWHCNAQLILSQEGRRCPAAGLLDPHSSPGIVGLPLFANGTLSAWSGFLAAPLGEPHWSLLWNQRHLNETPERAAMAKVLQRLGFQSVGITGGFTETQTRRAISDVQGLLSSRATLRVGVVGDGDGPSGAVDGLVGWCRKNLPLDEPGVSKKYPITCEVYDYRKHMTSPSAALIAELSEETGERVRWFHKGDSISVGQHNVDLVVLDQLGVSEAKVIRAQGHSPLSSGAVVRLNVRQDLGNAQILRESRVGRYDLTGHTLADLLARAVVKIEFLSASMTGGGSHLEFRPNGAAISQRLESGRFVAVTSSQVDPACFIRGVQQAGAYLWDFELPETLGFEEGRGGYYLLAKPPHSLISNLTEAARLVTENPPPAHDLLEAIAMRGIPMLKRMAAGGSHSRGELGMVLAVHLLQDAFRAVNSGVRLPVCEGDTLHFLLPVDSYWRPLNELRHVLHPGSDGTHPDLMVFSVGVSPAGAVQVKVTPVEVKFRDEPMSNLALYGALKQAENLGRLLKRLWASSPVLDTPLWALCGAALLAQCLDQCFRVYADPHLHGHDEAKWSQIHEDVIAAVLSQRATVTVNEGGRLVVFDGSKDKTESVDLDGDGHCDTVIVSRLDAEVLLLGRGQVSNRIQNAVAALKLSLCQHQSSQAQSCTELGGSGPPAVDRQGATCIVGRDEPDEASSSPSQPFSKLPLEVPQTIRDRVNAAFESFIGNQKAVRRVTKDILRALMGNPPHLAKNYLFTGQPSTGKTEMARRMARALGLPFVPLDGRSLTSRDRLFERIRGEVGGERTRLGDQAGLPIYQYPPFVVLIDEVHLVSRPIQESLLTMLEAADRTVTLSDHVAKVDQATFLFATTRASEIDPALRTRCTEIRLQEYEQREVAEILRRKLARDWPDHIYLEIATLGRCVPRVALELADELDTEITVTEIPDRSLQEHLVEVREARGIDSLGLSSLDQQYLEMLMNEDRPLGEQTVVNMLGTVDRDRVVDEIEPYLRRMGFIKLGRTGREITDKGKEYVLTVRRHRPR